MKSNNFSMDFTKPISSHRTILALGSSCDDLGIGIGIGMRTSWLNTRAMAASKLNSSRGGSIRPARVC